MNLVLLIRQFEKFKLEMPKKILIILSLILVSNCRNALSAQIRSDSLLAEDGAAPNLRIDKNGNIHAVWSFNGIYYGVFDSLFNFLTFPNRISISEFKFPGHTQPCFQASFASLGHIYAFNKSVDKNSLTQQSEIADGQTPNTFALLQNYPNPFNPETIIKYQITSPAAVSLKIYNLRGQEVRTLVDAVQNSGNYEIPWDGRNDFGNALASGVYVYRLQAGEQLAAKKLTLIH
jgi:hypothetical protein